MRAQLTRMVVLLSGENRAVGQVQLQFGVLRFNSATTSAHYPQHLGGVWQGQQGNTFFHQTRVSIPKIEQILTSF